MADKTPDLCQFIKGGEKRPRELLHFRKVALTRRLRYKLVIPRTAGVRTSSERERRHVGRRYQKGRRSPTKGHGEKRSKVNTVLSFV